VCEQFEGSGPVEGLRRKRLVLAENEERVGLLHLEEHLGRIGPASDLLLLEVVDDPFASRRWQYPRSTGVLPGGRHALVLKLALECGDLETAGRHIEDYDGFRVCGGEEPAGGKEKLDLLRRRWSAPKQEPW
jgi:hypothetical protein